MVLTWDQDPTELYGGIKIADTVQRLIRERLTAHTDEPRSREHEFPMPTSGRWPTRDCSA